MSFVTPAAACSSSLNCWCVVKAGTITKVFASPTLAKWEASLTDSMNVCCMLQYKDEWNATRSTKDGTYLGIALNTKSQNTTKTMQILFSIFMRRMVLQAGIRDPRYIFSSIEPLSQSKRVIQVALDSERQCFKTYAFGMWIRHDGTAFDIRGNTYLEAIKMSRTGIGRHQYRAMIQSWDER